MAKKILRRGMNFAFGGAGVFDTYSGIPNVSTQIDDLEDLIKHKVYTSVDLNNSVALLSVAGNDYANYKATNHSFKVELFIYLFSSTPFIPLSSYIYILFIYAPRLIQIIMVSFLSFHPHLIFHIFLSSYSFLKIKCPSQN